MNSKAIKFCFAFLILCLLCSCKKAPSKELHTLSVGPSVLQVELALDPQTRKKGLMHRETLPENRGMLFVFERSRILSFWMKNTTVPLSIAYIDETGRIIDIRDLHPLDEVPVASSRRVKYALEVNQGYFDRYGIQEGDPVLLPPAVKELP